MKLDFSKMRITLLVAPIDMRAGYSRLAILAQSLLGIDVGNKKDVVVFVSKRRQIAKLIWADDAGVCVLMRRLNVGRFEAFMTRVDESAEKPLTLKDLHRFLDGERLYVHKTRVFC